MTRGALALLALLCAGCAASVTVGRGDAETCLTRASGDHWSPDAIEALGAAAGAAAGEAARRATPLP